MVYTVTLLSLYIYLHIFCHMFISIYHFVFSYFTNHVWQYVHYYATDGHKEGPTANITKEITLLSHSEDGINQTKYDTILNRSLH